MPYADAPQSETVMANPIHCAITCVQAASCNHIWLVLQVEEMDNSGQWLPSKHLLRQCSQIFVAEIVIDIAKHAVVGKFNEIRPGVYREFMKGRCFQMPC